MFVKPEEIVKNIGLEQGMTVVDFGAGSGHYIIPAAKLVGEKGRVYAVDIQKDLLAAIKSNAERGGFRNVEIIWTDLEKIESTRLVDNSVDKIIVSNILFQVEDKRTVVREAMRILKKGGDAAVIEWNELKGGRQLDKAACEKIFKEAGFEKEKKFDAGDKHYGIIFHKP
ncbi:MAG: methyltransferase domain-containing protein [Candidatus Paceibacterota bacterium]